MAKKAGEKRAPARPTFASIPVEKLLFDTENPRLALGTVPKTDEEMVRVLWHEMAVDEVADSIAANGFFQEEPLIVIPKDPRKTDPESDRFIVVEGNRRLAAVRLLLDGALRKAVGAVDIPEVSNAVRGDIQKLPVAIYGRRQDVWAYLGFRHINGPKPWDALSKAQYVARVYEEQGIPLERIAMQIGDRNVTVKRLYRGYTLLRQAEEQARFDRRDANAKRFYFSHLYTAADQTEFQKFLGIEAETSLKGNPVPKKKLQELGELIEWIYGSRAKKKEPLVLTQFPDLNTLRAVLGKPEGIAALRAGYGLERASEIAIGDTQRFNEAMTRAKESLVQANGTVTTGYKGDRDTVGLADEIVTLASRISAEVQKLHSQKISKVRA
ncbi:MAG: hypothetical protein ABSG52_00380 [Terriglobales bacterium]|jgi:hypothetical protein